MASEEAETAENDPCTVGTVMEIANLVNMVGMVSKLM